MVDILDFITRLDIRYSWDIPGQRTNRETPIEILKKRFARGEITKEEYEDRKQILERDRDKK